MYDSLRFIVDRRAAGSASATLLNIGVVDTTTGDIRREYGGHGNFRIKTHGGNLLIDGSLAKFYFGNNLYTLTIRQTRDAIERLSDEMHLSLDKAHITRMDFGSNLILKQSASEYLSLFGGCKDYVPVIIGDNSRYYWPKGKQRPRPRELAFYDKIDECINDGVPIPEDFALTPNILRFEEKLWGRLSRQLATGAITGQTLYQPHFFTMMGDRWAASYFEVEKRNTARLDSMNNIKTVKDAHDTLLAMLIANDDKGLLEAFLRTLKERGIFPDPKYLSRLKRKLREINSGVLMMEAHELIKELNEHVRKEVEKYR